MPKLLHFVEKSHPILRETMPEVADFNDALLHKAIEDMCYSIMPPQLKKANGAHESAAGMAANQWGLRYRVFLFTPDGADTNKRLEVIINPSYVPIHKLWQTKAKMVAAYEGCFSVPLTTGFVNRFQSIRATYYNSQGEIIERILDGWEARVFQHETDHLNGKLFDGCCDNLPGPECLERYIFKDKEEMKRFWSEQVTPSRKKE